MDGQATLTTRRLRPLGPGDAGAIVDVMADREVVRWLAVVPFPCGRADADTFLASPEAAPGRAWAICDPGGLRLKASHMLGNDRSARVIEAPGMRPTGLCELHCRALDRTLPVRLMEMARTDRRRLRDRSRSSIAGPKETVQ